MQSSEQVYWGIHHQTYFNIERKELLKAFNLKPDGGKLVCTCSDQTLYYLKMSSHAQIWPQEAMIESIN